eukprot:12605331-Alexandrium_andersonii.AAC.1
MIVGRAIEPASSSTRHHHRCSAGGPQLWDIQLLLPRQQASGGDSCCKAVTGSSPAVDWGF